MLTKAAINGGRLRSEHAAVPVTPDEQGATVVECLNAGADVIHIHVRSTSGDLSEKERLYSTDIARTLLALFCFPQAQIGVSAGAWILPALLPGSRH